MRTVALLLTAVGGILSFAWARGRVTPETALLGAGSAGQRPARVWSWCHIRRVRQCPHTVASLAVIGSPRPALAAGSGGSHPLRGLGTPFTLALMLLAARSRRAMGEHRIGRGPTITGWIVTAVVTSAGALYLYQTFMPSGH